MSARDRTDDNVPVDDESRIIPLEIDDHYRMYGKEPWEIDYTTKCTLCDSRIDEYGFCACGSCGE